VSPSRDGRDCASGESMGIVRGEIWVGCRVSGRTSLRGALVGGAKTCSGV